MLGLGGQGGTGEWKVMQTYGLGLTSAMLLPTLMSMVSSVSGAEAWDIPEGIEGVKRSHVKTQGHAEVMSGRGYQDPMYVERNKFEIIDPFSLLGLLSFGTFLLTVLYTKFKKGQVKSSGSPLGGGVTGPAGTTTNKLAPLSQERIEQILTVAKKLLQDSATVKKGGGQYEGRVNVTSVLEEDYYDTEEDKRSHKYEHVRKTSRK